MSSTDQEQRTRAERSTFRLLPVQAEVSPQTRLMSQEDFAAWLADKVQGRIPTAAIRFGDGEARLLMADPDDPASVRDGIDVLQRETGLPASAADVMELKALMASAFERADVLGIRFNDRFLKGHAGWMKRLLAAHEQRLAEGRAPVPLASCLFGHDILDALPDLLARRRVSTISCRNLTPALEAWGVGDVMAYPVPSQHRVRDVDGAYEAEMHDVPIWPDAHDRVMRELKVQERGEVFLVGAGVFGKDLCIRIRDKGGIALDMGSALDKLASKITRGPRRRVLDCYARGMSVGRIATQVKRMYGAEPGEEKIMRLIVDAVDADFAEWQNRPLRKSYSAIHFDAIEVEPSAGSSSDAWIFHLALGDTETGRREALGIRTSAPTREVPEPALLADLEQRGVRDALLQRSAGSLEAFAGIHAAITEHGPFPDERAATMLLYLALRRAEVEVCCEGR